MVVATVWRVLFLLILLAMLVGVVVLQVHLSKKESKWPGLVLPVVALAISLLVVLGMSAFFEFNTFTQYEYIDGEWVLVLEERSRTAIPGAIGDIIYTFLLMNIPTTALLVIYASYKSKQSNQRALEKMNIQDLE